MKKRLSDILKRGSLLKSLFIVVIFLLFFSNGYSQLVELEEAESSPILKEAIIAHKNSDYKTARALYIKAMDECKPYTSDFYSMTYNMALLGISIKAYSNAEETLLLGEKVSKGVAGEGHVKHALFLSGLAYLYTEKGEFEKVEPLHLKALEIYRNELGNKHIKYANEAMRLAIFYCVTGKSEKADPLLADIEPVYENYYTPDDIHYKEFVSLLKARYLLLGNYEKAKYHTQKQIQYIRSTPGFSEKNPNPELSELLQDFQRIKEVESAVKGTTRSFREIEDSHFESELEDFKIQFGESDPMYINKLKNTAKLLKNSFKADSLYNLALQKEKEINGEHTTEYANILRAMALNSDMQHDSLKTITLYERALEANERSFGKYSKEYFDILFGYAIAYKDNFLKAEDYFIQSIEILQKQMENNFFILTEEERELFWKMKKFFTQYLYYYTFAYVSEEPSLSRAVYNFELFSKSLLLNSSGQIQRTILNSGDDNMIQTWIKLNDLKQKQATIKEYLIKESGVSDFSEFRESILNSNNEAWIQVADLLNRLEREINQIEKIIINDSQIYREKTTEILLTWEDVQQALGTNDVALEFIQLNDEAYSGSHQYAALILRPGYEYPRMITLCSKEKLQSAIQQLPHNTQEIYSLIWNPLEKYIENVNDIYLAPSGLLHSIPFAGIKKGNSYLGDEYTIHNLLSTKDIITLKEKKESKPDINTAVLFGGADFGLPNSELAQIDNDIKTTGIANLTRGMLDNLDPNRGQGFDYLPGSRKEVQTIHNHLSNLNWETSLFTDKRATETRLKSFSSPQSPRVLHISTHGFYFPVPEETTDKLTAIEESKNVYRTSDNPLMRAGLAFTGANHVWSGKDPQPDMDDGILTAYEISNMNLNNTELVILSACKTGLGDIIGSEGVYGLQRAFRLAGVQSMIVSLWDVPDSETVELMTDFYAQWTTGISKRNAFSATLRQLQMKYPDNPEKWAGFVLIE